MTFTLGDTRLPERFWSKVGPGNPDRPESQWAELGMTAGSCWQWTGSMHELGYGQFWVNGATRRAHRIAYMALAGEIPSGLVLDHLCRNRACCNPAHLEPVTMAENTRRGTCGVFGTPRDHCTKGHELTPENLVPSKLPARRCLTCKREQSRVYSKAYSAAHSEQRSVNARARYQRRKAENSAVVA